MNLTVDFEPTSLSQIDALRAARSEQLREPQELHLEALVQESSVYLVLHRGEAIGYCAVHSEQGLVEFHLKPAAWVFGEIVIKRLIDRLGIERALIQSFDDLFFSSAVAHQVSVRVLGMIVRDIVPRELPVLAGMEYMRRLAEERDVERIRTIEQDVFTHPERLAWVVRQGWVWLFEAGAELLGFGLLRPVRPGSTTVEMGIAVDTPFRNRGYAVYMLRDMIALCRDRGWRPIGGCAVNNLPSRRLGERVGLVARYRLLELRFTPRSPAS